MDSEPHQLDTLESLYEEATLKGIKIKKYKLPHRLKGLYYEETKVSPIITLSTNIESKAEEKCILAEEIGHYYTCASNILTNTKVDKAIVRQLEERASTWAVRKLAPISLIVAAFKEGASSKYEVAEYLGITENFLLLAIETYKRKYGIFCQHEDWFVYFDPFGFLRSI